MPFGTSKPDISRRNRIACSRIERFRRLIPQEPFLEQQVTLSTPLNSPDLTAIERICVLGGGTMGTGIAAHLANLGYSVTLIDVSREKAQEGIERARAVSPPAFMLAETAGLIQTFALADADGALAEADWICEAVVEKLEIKREVLARIDAVAKPDALITTNTSGLPISQLAEGRSLGFRRRFVGAHFFNPPRYLKLLELIPTEDTDPQELLKLTRFLEGPIARRVIPAKDTPGFVANRYGMWCLFHAIHTAEKLHLTLEQTDFICGELMGRPKSGAFRLADVIGVDVMIDIARGLRERCAQDVDLDVLELPASLLHLFQKGWYGDKAGQGFYRKEAKDIFALDLTTYAYRIQSPPEFFAIEELWAMPLGERLVAILDRKDEIGEFMRHYLPPTLKYAEKVRTEVSHSVQDFDRVMRWGFGWSQGPFELIDSLNTVLSSQARPGFSTEKYYDHRKFRTSADTFISEQPEPEYVRFETCPVVDERETLTVRDLGDGVLGIGFKTKLGVITPALVKQLGELTSHTRENRWVMVGHAGTSPGRGFSLGYDLKVFQASIEAGALREVDEHLMALQLLGASLEGHLCVAALHGYCLGAGLELALACPKIVASAEAKIGLPEAKVGLLPGGGGSTLMRMHNSHSAKTLADAALVVSDGRVSNNGPEAKHLGYLRPTDSIIFHPDRLLFEAKQAALQLGPPRPLPWTQPEGPVTGMIDRMIAEKKAKGDFSDYDVVIGDRVKTIFAKARSMEDALSKEREGFLDLCGKQSTLLRIKHMLETGKPLKN